MARPVAVFGADWLKPCNFRSILSQVVGIIRPARWRYIRGTRSKKKSYRLISILFGGWDHRALDFRQVQLHNRFLGSFGSVPFSKYHLFRKVRPQEASVGCQRTIGPAQI